MPSFRHNTYSILAPGFAKWRGSDARALAQALRKAGHNLIEIDAEDFVSWRPAGVGSKVLRRLFSGFWINDYNQTVLEQARASAFDFVLVFKGNFLKPETVNQLRKCGKPVYNFYPDVSFRDHGPDIPASLRFYDCVFTTKSYHGERELKEFAIKDLKHVRHGFDPEVHRPISLSETMAQRYACDASFVGCWSPEKEATLLHLTRNRPDLVVRVFGPGWNHSSSQFRRLLGTRLHPGVFGDELVMVYRSSRVNLGLLSAARSDRLVRDQTTARTFQIPATASFMLHEDTAEVRELFRNGEEVLLFKNEDELLEKLDLVLNDSSLRKRIAEQGFQRCQREPYDYSSAAERIVTYLEANEKTYGDRRENAGERVISVPEGCLSSAV